MNCFCEFSGFILQALHENEPSAKRPPKANLGLLPTLTPKSFILTVTKAHNNEIQIRWKKYKPKQKFIRKLLRHLINLLLNNNTSYE